MSNAYEGILVIILVLCHDINSFSSFCLWMNITVGWEPLLLRGLGVWMIASRQSLARGLIGSVRPVVLAVFIFVVTHFEKSRMVWGGGVCRLTILRKSWQRIVAIGVKGLHNLVRSNSWGLG